MIIKGKRGAPTSDEADSAPHPAPAAPQARESALIKNRGEVPTQPDGAIQQRKSSLMKKGTYAHTTADEPAVEEPEVRSPDPDAEKRVMIPTGDRPAPSAFGDINVGASTSTFAPVGPPIDQQILEEAKRRAEAIVRQAQLDAKKLLEESKIHCQNALQQAEKEGFDLGQQKGYEQSLAELGGLILQVRQMLSETVYGREKVLRSAEGEIAQLAQKVAERIIQTAVTTNPEVIKNQVGQALEKVKDREHITVRVNPQDLDVVRARRDMFHKLLEGPKTFDIQGDPKVDRGGVIIETNHGNVDARVNTQLQAIHVALAEVDKRMREEWERAAQAAAQQVLDQGLPPELLARVQPLPPPVEMIEAARQQALDQLLAEHERAVQQEAALAAAREAVRQDPGQPPLPDENDAQVHEAPPEVMQTIVEEGPP